MSSETSRKILARDAMTVLGYKNSEEQALRLLSVEDFCEDVGPKYFTRPSLRVLIFITMLTPSRIE